MKQMVRIAMALLVCAACNGRATDRPQAPPAEQQPAHERPTIDLPEAPPAVLQPATDQAFPAEPPTLVYAITGGFSGGGGRKIEIWRDGTVRVSRGSCVATPRKALLPAARVAALLDVLERHSVYSLQHEPPRCCDAFYVDLQITTPDKHAHAGRSEMAQDDDFQQMLRLIDEVVGPKLCRY